MSVLLAVVWWYVAFCVPKWCQNGCVPKWCCWLCSKVILLPRKSIAPVTQNDFRQIMKHVGVSSEAPRLPHETTLHDVWNLQKWPLCSTPHRHGPRVPNRVPTRPCCQQLRTHKQRRANTGPPPDPQSKTKTLRYAFDLPVTSQWPHNGLTGIMLSTGNHPNIPLIIRVVYSYKIYPNIWGDEHNSCQILMWKTRPANEPECSHVKHFCETSYFNRLIYSSTGFSGMKNGTGHLKAALGGLRAAWWGRAGGVSASPRSQNGPNRLSVMIS